MSEASTGEPVALPLRGAGKSPYHAWLDRRFPDGCPAYNPPVAEFLGSPSTRTAWTSHVPDGAAPLSRRMDLYLRRDWRGDAGTLCIGNAGPAGEDAPQTWTPDSVAMLRAALGEVEALAAAAGIARIAVTGADEAVLPLYRELGYGPADEAADTGELVKRLA